MKMKLLLIAMFCSSVAFIYAQSPVVVPPVPAVSQPATAAVSSGASSDDGFVLLPLPEDPRYNAPITISTSREGTPLREFVAAISRSIGLIPIVNEVPDTLIFDYEFEGTPFRQIFRIVLGLNGLDYILDDNNVVILGTIDAIAGFRSREPKPVEEVVEVVPQVPSEPTVPTEQRFFRVSANAEDFANAIAAAVPGANIEVLSGINSLSVTATAEQLEQVAAILEELDPPPAEALVTPTFRRVYSLSNAKAEELAEILRGIKVNDEEEQDNTSSVTTFSVNTSPQVGAVDSFATANNNVVQPEFTITPDPRTNTLIINATAKQHEQFAEIIPQLDVAQPQVNVQIRIQEINKSAASSLGVDMNAGFGSFAATLLDTGLNFVFNPQQAISGLNIGAVLDTMERQGLSRRVDDTTLTVLNNGEALMQAGGTIEVNLTGNGENIVRTIPYGVQITVSPQIAGANGNIVNLAVEAKVSDILSNTDDPSFIQFSDRNVSSTLSLESGQTVLLGGLFQNQLSESTRGVPILSSIPLVGSAFQQTSVEEEDTELLLIVTADIINNPNLDSVVAEISSLQ